ncbi:MAG TPA: helix-turn-helix transcriptional regulator [Polyangiaceae bacterium]|jgi:transcriptional regulator with XRE-family HTH domain
MKPNQKGHTSGTQPIAFTLGGRVRLERQRKGWSQAELATAIGMTPDALAQLETGETMLTRADVDRITAALGITVEQLVTPPNVSGMTKRGVG